MLIRSGSFSRIAVNTLSCDLPSNARRPVTISYSTHPRLNTSLRASASCPRNTSGAVYWNVPTIVPCWVSAAGGALSIDRLIVGVDGVSGSASLNPCTPSTPAPGFANPKSNSFAPPGVSMTFPGFRSRCRIPARCAFSSASQICAP